MMSAMSERPPHPLDSILAEVIAEEGGTCQATEVRAEIAACLDEIQTEQEARGVESPICHFYVTGGVAVFTLVGDTLDLYVVGCPKAGQWEIVNRFDRLARSDVVGFRRVLQVRYGKEQPDLVIKPGLAVDWLYGGTASDEAPGTDGTDPAAAGVRAAGIEFAEEPAAEESTVYGGYQGDPMLEQMMAAIRAAGGGKGNKPLRPSDL
jgi:hypothetical protein